VAPPRRAGKRADATLEFLLDFDGRSHYYAGGYWLKFRIVKVQASAEKPHGLDYSFTLHGPDGRRLVGFDNAHSVSGSTGRFKLRSLARDHWHRTESDSGRPYAFRDAEGLISDFFAEVERVLQERGVPFDVVDEREGK
jgi:hypothetical protein